MSYSRFTNSYWYTFWAVADYGTTETRDTAMFEVCTVKRFTAAEIRNDIDACVQAAVDACSGNWVKPTPQDAASLKEYMRRFLEDVDIWDDQKKAAWIERFTATVKCMKRRRRYCDQSSGVEYSFPQMGTVRFHHGRGADFIDMERPKAAEFLRWCRLNS